MSADARQQEETEMELDERIRLALRRVELGLGGKKESRFLAAALGSRFANDNDRRKDNA